jgi:copper chaperone
MGGCATAAEEQTASSEPAPGTLVLRVEDMTCSHCAATLVKAPEAGLPGARVYADPTARLVEVKEPEITGTLHRWLIARGRGHALAHAHHHHH